MPSIRRLPVQVEVDLHIVIITFLSPFPAYLPTPTAPAPLQHKLGDVLDALEEEVRVQNNVDHGQAPPTPATGSLYSDFGGFATACPRISSLDVKPLRKREMLGSALRAAVDRFEDGLLTAFDVADGKGPRSQLGSLGRSGAEWELGKIWAEKLEVFYEQSKWKPLDNFTKDAELDFTAMDEFIAKILATLEEHGMRAVGEYITSLLTRRSYQGPRLSKIKAEDVLYHMFEPNMVGYLDEEVEFVKQRFEMACRSWDKQLSEHKLPASVSPNTETARFLGSHNPAQVKRTVLASFTDVLLPVTIVSCKVGKAVGAAITDREQRWGGTGATGQGAFPFARMSSWNTNGKDGYVPNFEKGGDDMLFDIDIGAIEDDELASVKEKRESVATTRSSLTVSTTNGSLSSAPTSLDGARVSTPSPNPPTLDNFDLLLPLETVLEPIYTDRESMKRAETFSGYPGTYGHRVHDTIEEIFVLLLQALGERHIKPGFKTAIQQMKTYQPAEHEETKSVAPLLQFFGLVHIGDTMQSMTQVYFDEELAPHIDCRSLDDSVVGGLNAATDALMNQVGIHSIPYEVASDAQAKVEHVIIKLTKPCEYYPPQNSPLELGPTKGCKEAIKCLQMHCQLLKGRTSKEVLQVFYSEVGICLIAILQKHIKQQILSLSGGFQVIADLNVYHTFITSLRVASIISEFAYLKMIGHVYVVEDAKDLTQIVRDVMRYGGAYRPEVWAIPEPCHISLTARQDNYESRGQAETWALGRDQLNPSSFGYSALHQFPSPPPSFSWWLSTRSFLVLVLPVVLQRISGALAQK
ncbi:exocyst complex component Sec10-domain-containing protein [Trametes maxima]|nr:exocyst complex component Sec10-domain-containing protein [Trametes maxima]